MSRHIKFRPETSQHDKPKRWRPRFSIRTLLLLTLIVAGFVAIFVPSMTFRSGVKIYIRFPGTVQIDEAAEIRKAGVLVGKSRSIERQADGGYLVTASLRDDFCATQGDAFVFVPKTDETPGFVAMLYSATASETLPEDGTTVEGRVVAGPEAEFIRKLND